MIQNEGEPQATDEESYYSFTHSFIHQTFTEHLPCARHYPGPGETVVMYEIAHVVLIA